MRFFSVFILVASAFSQTLALKHVAVINPDAPTPQLDETVVIANGWISDLGRNVSIPPHAHIVDARGKFLIPGLWDAHTHVAGISAEPAWGKILLPQYLAFGVTSIRDMAGDVDTLVRWKRDQSEGRLLGPRMRISGPFVDGSKQGFDHAGDVIEAATPESGREAVQTLRNRGVDFIKIGSQLSRETFFAVADECKQEKIPFAGHVPNAITPLEASNAGMESEEHLLGIALSVSSEEENLRGQIAEARVRHDSKSYLAAVAEAQNTLDEKKAAILLEAFRRNQTWITPTLVWTEITSSLSHRTDSLLLKRLPGALQTKWAPGQSISSEAAEAYYQGKFRSDLRLVRLMNKAGVRLLAGSDSLDPYVFPGDSLHRELELLVKAGLSPIDALRTATLNPAELFHLQAELGTVGKGKRADLVLLDANPLDDIHNTRRIAAVIQGGRMMRPHQILAVNVTNTQ